MAMVTLLDLAKLQYNDTLTGLVEDVTTLAPEFSQIPTVTRPGTTYKIVRRTAYPSPVFRNVNAGATPVKSTYKQEVKEMFYLDAPINVDEAIVKGDDRSTGDILSHEMRGVLEGALINIGSQFYYGTTADSKGFRGLREQLVYAQAAGATTNSTSAYLVWLNPWGVHFDVGLDGQISLPAPYKQQIADPNDSTKVLQAWITNLSCYLGLSVLSDKSVYAVTGIDNTDHNTTNALTDAAAAALVSQIPIARRQGLRWFMNRQASYRLQRSRTAINYQPAGTGGQPAFAPAPTVLEGYPITLTDSITNTENNT